MFSRGLFRSKSRSDSFPKTHSSRSSSVTSGGDSGIDDDLNRSSASTMSNRSAQVSNFLVHVVVRMCI
jgi:hypothetical protein